MVFNLLWPIEAETVDGLALDQTVNEVRSFKRPAWRHLVLANLNLLRQDVVSDLFTRFSNIRSLPIHALIPDHAHCEVIDSNSMILPAHDLWCHVSWCSRGIFGIVRVPHSGDT